MELRFAHLADFASADSSGKLTVVGIFDIVWDRAGVRPIALPPFYLLAKFEASIAEGADHEIEITLVDDDENAQGSTIKGTLEFRTHGVGHPAQSHLLIGFGLGAVSIPDTGDYHFRFRVAGKDVGSVRLSALTPPALA